jgi:hypothetical protein
MANLLPQPGPILPQPGLERGAANTITQRHRNFRFLLRRRDARPISRQLYQDFGETRPRNKQWAVTGSGDPRLPTSILMLHEPAAAHMSILHTLALKIYELARWTSHPVG